MSLCVRVILDWTALHKGTAGFLSEPRRRSARKHACVPIQSHYKAAVCVSVGGTGAFPEISPSYLIQHLSSCVCQQFSSFSSHISSILDDLTGNLLNFPFASFLYDPANKEVTAPLNCICIDTVALSHLNRPRKNGNVYPDDEPQ